MSEKTQRQSFNRIKEKEFADRCQWIGSWGTPNGSVRLMKYVY